MGAVSHKVTFFFSSLLLMYIITLHAIRNLGFCPYDNYDNPLIISLAIYSQNLTGDTASFELENCMY